MVIRGVKAAARRLAREERGFTLVELTIAATLGVFVVGIAVFLFTAGNAREPGIASRSFQIQQGRTVAERIVREVRQASFVSTASPSTLTMVTYVDRQSCGGPQGSTAIACQVTYSCAAGACSRTERNTDGTGSAAASQVVAGLASTNVFCYVPSTNPDPTTCGPASSSTPTYVGLTLSFAPVAGQSAVTVDDGATLANAPAPRSS